MCVCAHVWKYVCERKGMRVCVHVRVRLCGFACARGCPLVFRVQRVALCSLCCIVL